MALLFRKHAPRAMVVLVASLIFIDVAIVGTWFGVEQVIARISSTEVHLQLESGVRAAGPATPQNSPGGAAGIRASSATRMLFIEQEVRDEVNRDVLTSWQQAQAAGIGAGGFARTFPGNQGEDVKGLFKHAHNDYLEFLLETGVLGAALLVMAGLASLAAALSAQRLRRNPMARGLAFGTTMGVIGMAIHASVDFNLQIPANAMTFSVLLSMAWLARYQGRGNH